MTSDLEKRAAQLAAAEGVAVDPFVVRGTCAHPLLRSLNGGICVLCDQELADADEELRALEEAASEELAQLDADAARLDLFEFLKQAWHVLEPGILETNWHHEAICRNVQGMLEEWLRRQEDPTYVMRWQNLLLNICPSTLKSRIVMVFAVAWMWLRCPTWSVLCVSANPENVRRDAEACRDLVTSVWYRETFGVTWKIRGDIDSKAKFRTTAGGERISRGLIAKFTGIHVDCILLDDPDDAHDVHSEAARRERKGKVEAMGNRVNDQRHCTRITLQQRVHVDDESGDALARGGWLHASYPLEYRDEWRRDTPFFTDPRTTPNENLHPMRFTVEVIAAERKRLGTQGFEAQYNQNPAPLEGGMIKRAWYRFFKLEGSPLPGRRPQGCRDDAPVLVTTLEQPRGTMTLDLDCMSITVDATFGSISETADRVGLLVVGNKAADRFVFEDATKVRTYGQTKQAIRDLIAKYPCVTRVLVEKKAQGTAIIDDLTADFPGMIGLEPQGGKESRASAMSPSVESGNWYLLDGAEWLDEYVTELCVFPHGKHDDRVDASSQLAIYFQDPKNAPRQWMRWR